MSTATEERPIQVAPARFVTIRLAAAMTGLTESAIETMIHRGKWVEGRQYLKREGRVYIDMRGVEKWVELGQA